MVRQLRGNKSNPDPTKDVRWGDQTWEEMMFTGLTFSIAPPAARVGRPALVIERNSGSARGHQHGDGRFVFGARIAERAETASHSGPAERHVLSLALARRTNVARRIKRPRDGRQNRTAPA